MLNRILTGNINNITIIISTTATTIHTISSSLKCFVFIIKVFICDVFKEKKKKKRRAADEFLKFWQVVRTKRSRNTVGKNTSASFFYTQKHLN